MLLEKNIDIFFEILNYISLREVLLLKNISKFLNNIISQYTYYLSSSYDIAKKLRNLKYKEDLLFLSFSLPPFDSANNSNNSIIKYYESCNQNMKNLY